jgi:hypothetical protein
MKLKLRKFDLIILKFDFEKSKISLKNVFMRTTLDTPSDCKFTTLKAAISKKQKGVQLKVL